MKTVTVIETAGELLDAMKQAGCRGLPLPGEVRLPVGTEIRIRPAMFGRRLYLAGDGADGFRVSESVTVESVLDEAAKRFGFSSVKWER